MDVRAGCNALARKRPEDEDGESTRAEGIDARQGDPEEGEEARGPQGVDAGTVRPEKEVGGLLLGPALSAG